MIQKLSEIEHKLTYSQDKSFDEADIGKKLSMAGRILKQYSTHPDHIKFFEEMRYIGQMLSNYQPLPPYSQHDINNTAKQSVATHAEKSNSDSRLAAIHYSNQENCYKVFFDHNGEYKKECLLGKIEFLDSNTIRLKTTSGSYTFEVNEKKYKRLKDLQENGEPEDIHVNYIDIKEETGCAKLVFEWNKQKMQSECIEDIGPAGGNQTRFYCGDRNYTCQLTPEQLKFAVGIVRKMR